MIMQAPQLPVLDPLPPADEPAGVIVGAVSILNTYMPVFILAFLATLASTPIVRRIAEAAGIVDKPDAARKHHARATPYLGGAAVFLGLMVGLAASYLALRGPAADLPPVPVAVVVGMLAIGFTGLADDIWKWDPRLKIAGQLVAAAALAYEEIGTGVAAGVLQPVFGPADAPLFGLVDFGFTNATLYYWAGTAAVAAFVLGGCNAANLIDGLDGLLSGTGAIMAAGLVAIALLMATTLEVRDMDQTHAAARVILPLILLGALLGFLPWNFNPAVIFLGDCGSLLIGYCLVTTIMMFAEPGSVSLVFAGLIVFALPIIDTMLAIIRRKVAGLPMSAPDANHLHHQLKRSLGSVRKAVLALYAVTAGFALLGMTLAAVALLTSARVLVIYSIVVVVLLFFVVVGYKQAWLKRELARGTSSGADAANGK